MHTTDKTALELVHRLLFRALIEIRAQGYEQKNKLVFHLADLFHNAVLDMEAAAEGKMTYEDVFRQLEEKAKEKNSKSWLHSAITQIDINEPHSSGGS
jgi:Mg/Co/Ni transporter MgtE